MVLMAPMGQIGPLGSIRPLGSVIPLGMKETQGLMEPLAIGTNINHKIPAVLWHCRVQCAMTLV